MAVDGRDGLNQFEADTPDAVVTDLLMPEMSGVELLAAIRAQAPEFPVVVHSADVQDAVREECAALNVNGHLTKPSKEELFIETIQCAIAQTGATVNA